MELNKYREELDAYALDFASRLTPGESISESAVTVSLAQLGAWTDVSADVLASHSVNGSDVQFTLKPAVNAAQPAGQYEVAVTVTTSGGRVLVGKADLSIS